MEKPSEIISAENVNYWRPDEDNILTDISFSIKKSENWVIFGPNGAGKTTLLKMITGYLHPSTGEIKVMGKTIGEANLPLLRKNIGWISSSLIDLIHPTDYVYEIILAGVTASTRLWQQPSKEELLRAKELIEILNLIAVKDKKFGIISQGEQQKVLIARALMNYPTLLILDEPCAGLDMVAREQLLRSITVLSQQRNSTQLVLVTHHVEEILPVFNHILYLKDGKVFEKGKISQNLNSELLSKLFELQVSLESKKDRYFSSVILA